MIKAIINTIVKQDRKYFQKNGKNIVRKIENNTTKSNKIYTYERFVFENFL